jgi:hypothetical protein
VETKNLIILLNRDMAEELALFDILLSAERSTDDRLNALLQLRPFLETGAGAEKLMAAVAAEESKEVKLAMLTLLCDIDITRITERDAYIHALAVIACLEPERTLRYPALERLATLAAHIPEIGEVLTDTLVNDLDTDIQFICITGLRNTVEKTADTIAKISAYIPVAPVACRAALLDLVQQFPAPHAAELALLFLDPLEQEHTRQAAILFLAGIPVLPPAVLSNLTTRLGHETSLSIRTAIIQLLSDRKIIDTALFADMFAALQRMPDQPELLTLVTGRLVAYPHLQEDFNRLFAQTTSAGLKIRLLTLLQQHDLPHLIISGLQDTNPYVREAVLPLLIQQFPKQQEQLEPALAKAIQSEPLTGLRSALMDVILQTGRKSSQTEALLVDLAIAETDHALKIKLATAVCEIPINEENRRPLLQLFAGILEGGWYPAALKQQVMSRLQTFAYSDDPDLKKSLGLLLEQAKDIYELDRIYKVLKTLETDFSQLAPSLLRALYRHIAWYPQQPLDEWVQLLGKLADQHADIRAALPYFVSLTKATWLLKGADKADQTGAFLPAFQQVMLKRNGTQTYLEAERLLADAWNNRTIKKSEVVELYKMLLRTPKSAAMLQQLLRIMQEGKLVTPELVTLSLDYILVSQDKDGIYQVRKYLEQVGFIDLEYRQRLVSIFTQAHYERYMQFNAPEIHSKKRYTTLNDWEYGGWICPYTQWPVAALIFAIEPGELPAQIFNQLPDNSQDPAATLPYLVLEHLFRNSNGVWAKYLYKETDRFGQFLTWLYNGYQQLSAGNALGDRMLFVFWKKWNDYVQLLNGQPVPPHLADAAAYIYSGICQIVKRLDPSFNGKQFPNVLKSMNVAVVQQNWPWSADLWDMFEYKYFPKKDPDQEAAVQLFQQAASALQSDKLEEGYQLLKDLLQYYPHTRQVKEQSAVINNAIQQLEAKFAAK